MCVPLTTSIAGGRIIGLEVDGRKGGEGSDGWLLLLLLNQPTEPGEEIELRMSHVLLARGWHSVSLHMGGHMPGISFGLHVNSTGSRDMLIHRNEPTASAPRARSFNKLKQF